MSQGANMNELKSITLRLPDEEYKAFDAICSEKGYSKTGKIREFIRRMIKEEIESVKIKTGKIREFIRRMIKEEIESVKISAEEWERVKTGIKEIEKGKFATFEDLKRDFEKRKMGNK
jgi:predicted DNA-binding protein